MRLSGRFSSGLTHNVRDGELRVFHVQHCAEYSLSLPLNASKRLYSVFPCHAVGLGNSYFTPLWRYVRYLSVVCFCSGEDDSGIGARGFDGVEPRNIRQRMRRGELPFSDEEAEDPARTHEACGDREHGIEAFDGTKGDDVGARVR